MPCAVKILVTEAQLAPAAETAALTSTCEGGALSTFVGFCRSSGAGGAVRVLELQHYPAFTEATIQAFAKTLAAEQSLLGLTVIHRVGQILPGEAIVFVAATSAHRANALRAVETMMDFLKTDAPFWKREHTASGAQWIEPSPQDYARRAKAGMS